VRRYRVDRPCPELGLVLIEVLREVGPGEEFVVETGWRYVVEDLRAAAPSMGLEVVSVSEEGGRFLVVLKRKH